MTLLLIFSNFLLSDLLEVDVEAGTTKVLKEIGGDHGIQSIAVNLNEDAMLIDCGHPRRLLLDADLNATELEYSEPTRHVLDSALRLSGSDFIPIASMLDFGQWFKRNGSETVSFYKIIMPKYGKS